MVRLTMSDGGEGNERANMYWDRVVHALQPEIEDLTEGDKKYYRKIKFLIGKEPKHANFPRHHTYYYIKLARKVFLFSSYPMLINEDYFRRAQGEYVNATSTTLSVDGLGFKYGPGGFQQQKIIQEFMGMERQKGVG